MPGNMTPFGACRCVSSFLARAPGTRANLGTLSRGGAAILRCHCATRRLAAPVRAAAAGLNGWLRHRRWHTPLTTNDLHASKHSGRKSMLNTAVWVGSGGPAYGRLSEPQRQQVDTYIDQLLKWNQHMNITAVRDRDEAMLRHVEDSLALLPVIEMHCSPAEQRTVLHLIDVGSGGGLPGLLLAIARPDWKVTLLDSLRKRCDFVAVIIDSICKRQPDATPPKPIHPYPPSSPASQSV